MNFITYITKPNLKHTPCKDIDGQIIRNCLNVNINENIEITNINNSRFQFYQNKLTIWFDLFYKKHLFVNARIQLDNILQCDFSSNQFNSTSVKESLESLNKCYFETIFKFELSNKSMFIYAKNDTTKFQLKTQFEKLDLSIDFVNTISFIDTIENKEKNNQLFYTICDTISDEQLISISKASPECDKIALPDLQLIKNTKILPKEISWDLSRVIQVTRDYKATTFNEHQNRLFACSVILSKEHIITNMDAYPMNVLAGLFLSATALNLTHEARAFIYTLTLQSRHLSHSQFIAYAILGCDLVLKDEKSCTETFKFLQDTYFLEELSFNSENNIPFSAKRMRESALIMLENTSFIKDKTLKNTIQNFFKNLIQICEEHYDIKAINALFERTFTKQEQEEYLNILPELVKIRGIDVAPYLRDKGLNGTQVKSIMKSLNDVQRFRSNYEIKRNVFFDAIREILYLK